MKKLLLALALSTALLGLATAAQPEQSHNLSEIHPIDEDFNMSDRKIYNLSSLELNDGTVSGTGLVFDDYTIRDSGNNYLLELDTANAQWNITGSNLNMNNNKIKQFFSSACTGDKVVTKVNSDGSYQCTDVDSLSSVQDLNTTLEAGNTANQSILMAGNNIEGVNALDLDSTGDIRSDGTDAIRLDSNQNVNVPNGQLQVQDGSSGSPAYTFSNDADTGIYRPTTDTLGLVTGGTREWQVTSGGNLQSDGSGSLVVGGNEITQVGGSTDASSGAIRLANSVDIQARDSGNSNDIQVIGTDSSDNVEIGANNNIGDLELVNGDLDVSGGDFFVDDSSGEVGIGTTSPSRRLELGDPSDATIEYARLDGLRLSGEDGANAIWQSIDGKTLGITSNGGRIELGAENGDFEQLELNPGGPQEFRNPYNNNVMLRMNNSGGSNVEIPNGNLDLKSNAIQNADWSNANGLNGNGQVVDTTCTGSDYLAGDGTCAADSTVADDQNLKDVLSNGHSAGSYSIDMNSQNINSTSYLKGGGNSISLEGGNWDFITDSGEDLIMYTGGGGSDQFRVRDEANGGTNVFSISEGGPIDFRESDSGTDIMRLDSNGNTGVEIPNGNLDVSSPSYTGGAVDVGGQIYSDGDIRVNDSFNQFRAFDSDSSNPNDDFRFNYDQNELGFDYRDASGPSTTEVLNLKEGGNIEVPSGNLGIGASSPSQPLVIEKDDTATGVDVATNALIKPNSDAQDSSITLETTRGTSNQEWNLRSGSGNSPYGQFRIYDATASTTALSVENGTQNIEIPNGDLELNNNLITSNTGSTSGSTAYRAGNNMYLDFNNADGGGNFYVRGGSGYTKYFQVNSGGPVEVKNAQLQFGDSDSDSVTWGVSEDSTNGHLTWDANGGGGNQMDLEHNGNLRIEGSLTEGASLDVAENMRVKQEQRDDVKVGDVVGIQDGEVSRNTTDAALNMVVSAAPGITLGGKDLDLDEEEKERFENSYRAIAFTGQVPVKVSGEASEGDYLLPSGENDGTAVAVQEEEISFEQYRNAVGVVLEKFEMPENVNSQTERKYRELLEEAESEDYQIYNVAVGVK